MFEALLAFSFQLLKMEEALLVLLAAVLHQHLFSSILCLVLKVNQ